MSFLDRLPWRRSESGVSEHDTEGLANAEALLRAGGAVDEIRQRAGLGTRHNDVEEAWMAMFLGDLDAALQHGYTAASERPYDVDSRIVHGTARLARNELEHADYEFEAVIEEFGAESDAMDGRRAVILAYGYAPLDELPATADDWSAAARLLTTLWRLAGLAEARMSGLEDSHPEGQAIISRALANGQARDLEFDDGSV